MGLDGPRSGILVGKLLKSNHLKQLEDNIKMYLRKIGYVDVYWIEIDQDRAQWWRDFRASGVECCFSYITFSVTRRDTRECLHFKVPYLPVYKTYLPPSTLSLKSS